MSYQLISSSRPTARKSYGCIWCVENIKAGERHVHEVGKYAGDLQDTRWHLECHAVAHRHFRESGEGEFEAHEFKRGSIDEA